MQQKAFYLLLAIVTIAFFWILKPFFGAVFWGVILAIIFMPVNNRLNRAMPGHPNLSALITLLLCLIVVVLPMSVVAASLVNEGTIVVQQIRSGQINFGAYFEQAVAALPSIVSNTLQRFELTDFASVQEKLAAAAGETSQFLATRALSIGQNTAQFVISFGVMLYLLFFLLRDGHKLTRRIRMALPLSDEHKQLLLLKFTGVIRATIKGNIAVAALQGLLGGLMFWALAIQGAVLWGVVMAVLSLLPAVGAGLIWGPVAIYFLLTGALWKGVAVIAFGALVIGAVDNVLRPILVGKDTKMPDWVILISTLGGMALFGINGFVIGPMIAALFIASWDLFSSMRETEGSGA
ncbi:putative PurR-regulated permease PerM [Cupriavidus gilardii J11]|uniref:Putative PurR-regulated permease PerM n=1 Tax=Cupriavidus gilardii J11 TaxID=936133 RepID=A0A562BMS2_9BURK|nr:AI-2E family transporter [Cupriavidus gilardii]TWG86230.1 putative PurR-regulated permease PerM [Cupriavidus gilardii J11]